MDNKYGRSEEMQATLLKDISLRRTRDLPLPRLVSGEVEQIDIAGVEVDKN